MQENRNTLPLYIPSRLKLKEELFPGFEKECLLPTIVSSVLFIILDCILWICGVKDFAVMLFVVLCGTSTVVFMQVKGDLNLSPIDILRLEIDFLRSQKYYPYIAKNEWEHIE